VRRFVNEVCRPNEQLVSETNAIPEGSCRRCAISVCSRLSISEAYGGLGLTMEEEALVILEMGRTSPAFRSTFGTNVGIGSQGIVMFGTEDQKRDWLPKLADRRSDCELRADRAGCGIGRGFGQDQGRARWQSLCAQRIEALHHEC